MEELQIFKNEKFGKIRTIVIDGEPYLVGKDVAEILGYQNASKALLDHVDDEDKLYNGTLSSLGQRGGWLINESGLYALVLSSKMQEAKKFRRWITREVIPSIRKTGGYVSDEQQFIETYLPYADDGTKALFSQTLGALRKANAKIEADKPKVLFADAVSASNTAILVGDLAKLIKQNGVDIGQKRLFEWMRENGYLIKNGTSRNMPTQRSMDQGLFHVKETTITNPDGSIRITRTTKVTGKGQNFFVNKFLGEEVRI